MATSTSLRTMLGGFGVVALSLLLPGSQLGAQGAGETRSYMVSEFHYSIYSGDFNEDCPHGFEPKPDEAYKTYLAAADPKEYERLSKPENFAEFVAHWKSEYTEGPEGEDICSNPKSFVNDKRHPFLHVSQSKVALGMNLDGTKDGKATPITCAHQKLQGPNGEPGIDNQLSRAMGCVFGWRGNVKTSESVEGGDQIGRRIGYMKDGTYTIVMQIKGITDLKNDDVELGIYSSDTQALLTNSDKRAYIPNQTFTVSANPRWRNVVHGKIVDGVLTTDTIDVLRLMQLSPLVGGLGTAQAHEYELHRARFRLTFNSDGSLRGLMGAYDTLTNVAMIMVFGGKGNATASGVECASEYKTAAALADGFPDSKTGDCTMISTAYNVEAIPAFLVWKDSKTSLSTADATGLAH